MQETTVEAQYLTTGDTISNGGIWSEVIARTPVYANGGFQMLTIVLRDEVGMVRQTDIEATRLVKMRTPDIAPEPPSYVVRVSVVTPSGIKHGAAARLDEHQVQRDSWLLTQTVARLGEAATSLLEPRP